MNMPSNWYEVKRIAQSALDKLSTERQAFIDKACGEDLALRESVQSLLNEDNIPDEFLEPPIAGAAHQLLAEWADQYLLPPHD